MNPLYSKENLIEIAGGDDDFISVIVKTFLDEIPPDLSALQEAIENDNKELAYQFAHKMKPNLEMFGIELAKEITGIESWTKTSKNKAAISPQITKVVTVLTSVFKELSSDYNV